MHVSSHTPTHAPLKLHFILHFTSTQIENEEYTSYRTSLHTVWWLQPNTLAFPVHFPCFKARRMPRHGVYLLEPEQTGERERDGAGRGGGARGHSASGNNGSISLEMPRSAARAAATSRPLTAVTTQDPPTLIPYMCRGKYFILVGAAVCSNH